MEVICEGVPSPLYIRKYEQSLKKKFGALIESIDYRYKGHSFLGHHKWDFEIMRTTVMMNDNKKKVIEKRPLVYPILGYLVEASYEPTFML